VTPPQTDRGRRTAGPRLLFVSTVYPSPWDPHKGPVNHSTVESLRLSGCDVDVVVPVPWIKKMRSRTPVLPAERYPTYWYPPGMLRTAYHRVMAWSIGASLRDGSAQSPPDAVLAFWTDPDGTVALRHARKTGVRCGVIVGGSDVMLLPAHGGRRRIVAATLSEADHVFAVGSLLQQKVIDLGAAPERVSNFLCGVDLTNFGPGEQRAARARVNLPSTGPILLWIGQMVNVKAPERLLLAAADLVGEFPDLTVVLVGDGPRRAALQREVDGTPALRNRVRFTGAVANATLPDWYRAADLFVLPSRSEGVPTVLLEAMACGLPFVASDVGSIRDLLPFGESQVVPEGNIPALAGAIMAALRASASPPAPRRIDRMDGARHLLHYLGLA
jgi:teichuronic acid biosynthesis glycosyltransferase TuaC